MGTLTEERTLTHIMDNYKVSESAKALLRKRLKRDESSPVVSKDPSAKRTVSGKFQTALTHPDKAYGVRKCLLLVVLAWAVCSIVMAIIRPPQLQVYDGS